MGTALVLSTLALVGILIAFTAASLTPARGALPERMTIEGPIAGRLNQPTMRERINVPFQALVDVSNRQRRLNGGLTLTEKLIRADIKLVPSELVMIQIAFLVGGALVALLRFGFGWQFVVAGVLAFLIPMRYVNYRQRKRLAALNGQLPDTVGLLSNALKAGLSLPQALDTVARNSSRPISEELTRVVREMSLGVGATAALSNMVRRVGSQDLDLVVIAISIQMAVGGNLARLLDTISLTVRQRIQVKEKIGALTAQARASGWIITLLPLVVATFLYFVTPTYFRPMFESALGIALLIVAAIAILVGNLLVRRIVNFRV